MIKQMVGTMDRRDETPHSGPERYSLGKFVQSGLARKRMGSILFYRSAALILAVVCSISFSFLEENTAFAISVMGSLIGGFLGALLAATLIVDMYAPKQDRDRE